MFIGKVGIAPDHGKRAVPQHVRERKHVIRVRRSPPPPDSVGGGSDS
jgi:hypothetical protein